MNATTTLPFIPYPKMILKYSEAEREMLVRELKKKTPQEITIEDCDAVECYMIQVLLTKPLTKKQ